MLKELFYLAQLMIGDKRNPYIIAVKDALELIHLSYGLKVEGSKIK